MTPRPRVRCRWAVGASVLVFAVLAVGSILWHRAVFGPWTDAWQLGNGLLLVFVCGPLLWASWVLAGLAGMLAVRVARRGERRGLGMLLVALNAVVLVVTTSAIAWQRKADRLARSDQPLTRQEAKWFTPWGWKAESRLHHAVKAGDEERVRKLVRQGADVNAPPIEPRWRPQPGQTPLQTAIAMGDAEMVALLVELGADPRLGGRSSPMWFVLQAGDMKMLETMHDAGASLPPGIMAFACREGRPELVTWLIDRDRDVNSVLNREGSTEMERYAEPLHAAISAGQIDIVRLLLDHGADIDTTGSAGLFHPLALAAERSDSRMLLFLLDQGADPAVRRKNGWNAVHSAAFAGSLEALKILTSRAPTLLDERTDQDTTPLWLACMAYRAEESLPKIRFLLAGGADPGVTNRRGESIENALSRDREIAIGRGDEEAVRRIEAVIELLSGF